MGQYFIEQADVLSEGLYKMGHFFIRKRGEGCRSYSQNQGLFLGQDLYWEEAWEKPFEA